MSPWRKISNPSTAASAPEVSGYAENTPASRRGRGRQAWRVVLPSLLFIFVALMFAAHSLAQPASRSSF